MTLVPLPVAKMHIRAEDAADDEVTPYLSAAELAAASFLNRQVYATQGELDAAVAGVPAMLTAAGVAHTAAVEAAEALEDAIARATGVAYADTVYARAQDEAREIRAGMVVNDAVKAAILLLFGHLHANREDAVTGVPVAQMPMGSQYLLMPYRVGMGV